MPRRKAIPAASVVIALLLATSVAAQQARLDITINDVQACEFGAPPGLVLATVSVVNAYPFQTVRFKAPVPCGMIYTGEYSSGNVVDGSSQTGVTVTMSGCTSIKPVPVLTIIAYASMAVSGCTWDVSPADGDSDILLTDCDGNTMKGASARSLFCWDVNGFIGPYLPDPPDGATNVPLNTLLSVTGDANEMYLMAEGAPYSIWNYPVCSVFPGVQLPQCTSPFDPGTLEPNTTYHWVALNACVYCPHGEAGFSDIWSFTTGEGPSATEQSTWGRVKALYRE